MRRSLLPSTSPFAAPSATRHRLLVAGLALLALGAGALALEARAAEPEAQPSTSKPQAIQVSDAAIDAWSAMPVQEGGRVKPLYTWAKYALMRMNGRAKCDGLDGETLDPIEWALQVMFLPESGKELRCFMVENDEVLAAVEIEVEGRKKRDRYTYNELAPSRKKLAELGRRYGTKPEKERDPVEGGIVALHHAMMEFEGLAKYADAARQAFEVPKGLGLLFDGKETVTFSEVVGKMPELVRKDMLSGHGGAGQGSSPAMDFVQSVARYAGQMLSLFPPTLEQEAQMKAAREQNPKIDLNPEEWKTPWELIARPVQVPSVGVEPVHVAMLADLEAMASGIESGNVERFTQAAERFHQQSEELTSALGLYDKVELEVKYHRWSLLHWGMGFFFLGFVVVLVSLLWPNAWVIRGAWLFSILGVLAVAGAIAIRCILRERPPVTTLYETVVFITGTGAAALLVVEWMSRRRIALVLAPLIGLLGVLLANGYELSTKEDTMPRLVAVLDTNFWLLIHVICISIGYMASLLTGAIAHIYVLGKVFGLQKGNNDFYRSLSRMIYGTLAFALIFSVVGTILGGIWANESWGRFWGWDPKENGALMIVLWQLAMIHARLGGFIKPFGVAMASIFLSCIVAFSWWGVNLLGIGLHTYGFTQGILTGLLVFYGIEATVMAIGFGWWLLQRAGKPAAA